VNFFQGTPSSAFALDSSQMAFAYFQNSASSFDTAYGEADVEITDRITDNFSLGAA
jgi:hypothetical protein